MDKSTTSATCKLCNKKYTVLIEVFKNQRKQECPDCRYKKTKESKRKDAQKRRDQKRERKAMKELKTALESGTYTEVFEVIKTHFLKDVVIDIIEEHSRKVSGSLIPTSGIYSKFISRKLSRRTWSEEEIKALIEAENNKKKS